jgi:uncharacterized metal-binding protein YceD (DUF177 family)
MTALRDWTHATSDVGDEGLACTRDATAEERIELARELDILSCERLSVRYLVRRLGQERYSFSGTLEAEVTQACVVSLEPVSAVLTERFSIDLAPRDALSGEEVGNGDRLVSSVPDEEPIEDGRIAAGTLVFGVLSAALDPYPRKAGVEFAWVDPKLGADPEAANPFAALAKLKRDP